MKKELKDYTSFKLTENLIIQEARLKCMREMYAKSQPSASYDEIVEYYKDCNSKNIKPDQIYCRHYLSSEEFKYIIDKYIEAYHLKNQFKADCDIIIRDLKEGCHKDMYIPELMEDNGIFHSPNSSYENIPPISKMIGNKNAKKVINFIKHRKDYYRFDRVGEEFSILISMGDSPTCNAQEVINYWKTQGIDIKIDPRHYTNDDFWCEENGYLNEEDE